MLNSKQLIQDILTFLQVLGFSRETKFGTTSQHLGEGQKEKRSDVSGLYILLWRPGRSLG